MSTKKNIFYGLLIAVAVLVVASVSIAVSVGGKVIDFASDVSGDVIDYATDDVQRIDDTKDLKNDIADDVLTSTNAIYNYEWFKQQYQDIQRLEKNREKANIYLDQYKEGLPEDSTLWSRQQNEMYNQLFTDVKAQDQMLTTAIANYNARADMQTRNLFKDGLPTNILSSTELAIEYVFSEDSTELPDEITE